ncbi:MAG TPA: GGDEF domain-containing protein [Steroidobacteraceae bacterium]|jgi:diguanylate cyclase (GGDEF)-like protein|nr:GGDEF domain-containing protein [Steroidobacteraceae bacterium]
MRHADSNGPGASRPAGAPPQSPHALQLQRGFPRLRFTPQLEAEFRAIHLTETLPQVRRNLWLAIVFVIAFSGLTHLVLDEPVNRTLDLIRLVMFTPILLIGLVVVYSPLYQRLYPLVSQVGAPTFGIGVTVLAVIAASHGVSLIATVVLVSIYIFFMLGMTFYSALGSSLLVFASYFISAAAYGLAASVQVIDGGVLIFTNVIGAMVCYTLERATRTNYLEERLLIETASRDGLTGIHNRRLFDEHVDRIWPQATRDRASLGLLLIDIDHFKAYNDYYGHQAGDECLRQVAWCLSRCSRRPLDITARYGGEEFAIVLYEADRSHVEDAARRIQAEIESLNIVHAASPATIKRLTVSIGAACIMPKAGRTHYGFIQLADEALYDAKERGRNCVVIMDKEYEQLSTGAFRGGNAPLPPPLDVVSRA